MSKKKLYHGTTKSRARRIHDDGIDLYRNEHLADFGHGFYLAIKKEIAERRANDIAQKLQEKPSVLSYELDMDGLDVMKYSIDEKWGREVYEQRVNGNDNLTCDVAIGPIADGYMKALIWKIKNGKLTQEDFMKHIVGNITKEKQVVIKTDKALHNLKERGVKNESAVYDGRSDDK